MSSGTTHPADVAPDAPGTPGAPGLSPAAPGAPGSPGSPTAAGGGEEPAGQSPKILLLRFLIPLVVGLVIWFLPAPDGVKTQAWHLFAIFVATIVGVIAKPLPMGAVTIIGVAVTALTQTLTIAESLSGFANPTIWLIVMAFLISRGVIKTGLGKRIALFFVSRLGRRTLGVAYGLMATDLVLAPATPSNTARAGGVIMPIQTSVARAYGSEPNDVSSRKVGAYLTLSAFHVNAVTSAMFLTAMAANPLAAELAGDQGVNISWGRWALAALVPGLVCLLLVPFVLYKLYPPELKETPEAAESARQQLRDLGPLSRHEKIMAGTIVLLLLLWTLGDALWDLSATTTALVGLVVLLVTGVLTWEDVKKETQAWDTLVWFAALVMMATFLNSLGLIPWLSDQMSSAVGDLGWLPAFIILTLAYYYSHYLFASNTAHVSAMYSAFLAAAILAGAPALFAALVLGYISSLFATLTHYSSGPAPVLFASGYVPLGPWWRNGLATSLLLVVVWMGVGGLWMKALGMW